MTGLALDGTAVQELSASFGGDLVIPDDARYDEARTVFNAMIDRRPALIARCQGVADVVTALRFARERGLPVAVRGGGTRSRVTACATTAW